MVVDFCLPSPGQSMLEALEAWHAKSKRACADYSFHMAVTWWSEQIFDEMQMRCKADTSQVTHSANNSSCSEIPDLEQINEKKSS